MLSRLKHPTSLLWIGLLTGLVYLAFCVFYNQPAWSGPRLNRELFVWPTALALGYLYWATATALKHDGQHAIKLIVGFAVAFVVLALATPAFHSTDVMGYINRGWQQWHYDSNPYTTVIDQIPGWQSDSMLSNHWVTNPSPYGFLYLTLAKYLCALSEQLNPGDLPTAVFIFKLFNVFVFGLIAWVLYQITGLLALNAAQRNLALLLFLWNPLMILHQLMNGHNDLVMAACIMLAFWAVVSNRWLWVLPTLTAAVLVKYAALVMLPFAMVFLWRRQAGKDLAMGAVLSVALIIMLGWPYLSDWQHFQTGAIGHNAQISHSSLHSVFYNLYKALAQPWPQLYQYKETAKTAIKILLLGVYGVLMTWWLMKAAWPQSIGNDLDEREFSARRLMAASTTAMFILVCFVTFKFYPWYFGMFFPLLLVLPEGYWLRRLGIVLSVTHLLSITFIGQAHILNYVLMVIAPIIWGWGSTRIGKNVFIQA